MVSRGTIVVGSSSITLNITKERINLRAGIVHKSLPTLASSEAWQAAVFGRGREIQLEGYYAGTQAQIELVFLAFFENWMNGNVNLQDEGKYYPLFNKSNGVTGSQSRYWRVLGDDFQYDYDSDDPSRITFTLTMREGSKIGPFAASTGADT